MPASLPKLPCAPPEPLCVSTPPAVSDTRSSVDFHAYLSSLLGQVQAALLMERSQSDSALRDEISSLKREHGLVRVDAPIDEVKFCDGNLTNHKARKRVLPEGSVCRCDAAVQTMVDGRMSSSNPASNFLYRTSSACASSVAEIYRPNQATHSFQPGEMGIVCDDRGFIQEVTVDGPAYNKGIKRGDMIVGVGAEPYSRDTLHCAEQSGFEYDVIVQVRKRRSSGVVAKGGGILPKTDAGSSKNLKEKLEKLLVVHDLDVGSKLPTDRDHIVFFLDQVMGIATLLNIAVIGISSDLGEGWQGWIATDIMFASVFVGEMLAKIWILGCKRYWAGAAWKWSLFEVALVVMAVTEIAIVFLFPGEDKAKVSALRIIRCARVTRLVRVRTFTFFIELTQMVQGALGGMRTLMWAGILIAVPLYAVALVLHEMLGHHSEIGASQFATFASSFFTVWRCIVAGDCSTEDGRPIFVLVCSNYGWGFGLLYVVTQTFMTFGLFNVIVAIYVENIVAAAKYNDLIKKRHRLEDGKMMVGKLMELMAVIVKHHDGNDTELDYDECIIMEKAADVELSPKLFNKLLYDPEFRYLLAELDISIEDQLGLFDSLDVDGSGSLNLPELIQGIKKLRGDPRRSDVIHVGLVLQDLGERFHEFQEEVLSVIYAPKPELSSSINVS